MTTWMALFGLVWLLRVRGSLCGCAACKRARSDAGAAAAAGRAAAGAAGGAGGAGGSLPRSPRASPQHATFDVVALDTYTRDVTVQTDFDDEEDLDKIELQISEESHVSNYEGGRESPVGRRAGHYQPNCDESVWESVEVSLERGSSGLGLSIAGGETGGDVTITRLAAAGAASTDGRLQIGDILLQVNDVSVEGAPHSVAVEALQKAGNVVRLRVRRARRPRIVTLCRGARGLGLGIAGGADDGAGGDAGVFVSHIAVGGAAHHDGRLRLGDKILAVRDDDGIETSLIGATHAQAVAALRRTGEHVTLIVLPAGSFPPVAKTAPLYSTRTQATSCSTLHELLEEEHLEIPRCVRMVRLVRSGSRLGMDIVGGLGGEGEPSGGEDDTCGVFVSGVAEGGAASGMLHRGDRILSVDGRDLTRATHEQAAAALKYSGAAVTIAAQYQPEQYERLRARIRAINAGAEPRAPHHAHSTHVPVHPDLHVVYPR
ncbi:disks large homolog 2-like isoform X3 [Pectinophora gossypiella]|uniref:disks large homolog 2-like isoform X3 n=1 Tax=Pectinophora gossypiella TaxID=13191 RepID=UPI00214EDEAF|nr:disks large homolog 2-like isoform X3 [Pectinophora gossypiella]